MSNYTRLEIAVGAFVAAGLALLGFLSLSIGGLELFTGNRYQLEARFSSVGDLSPGAAVRLAGVKVGRVASIGLDNYAAEVVLDIDPEVALPADTIASIRNESLLGQSFVSLSPGASEVYLADGGRIPQTEPAIDLLFILSKYALGRDGEPGGDAGSRFDDPLEDR